MAHVRNDGSDPLSVSGRLRLSQGDASGLRAGPLSLAAVAPIMPGRSQLVTTLVPSSVPPGRWRAQLLVSSGTVTHTATAVLAALLLTAAATRLRTVAHAQRL